MMKKSEYPENWKSVEDRKEDSWLPREKKRIEKEPKGPIVPEKSDTNASFEDFPLSRERDESGKKDAQNDESDKNTSAADKFRNIINSVEEK